MILHRQPDHLHAAGVRTAFGDKVSRTNGRTGGSAAHEFTRAWAMVALKTGRPVVRTERSICVLGRADAGNARTQRPLLRGSLRDDSR